jgi:hypothetical protein
MKLAGILAQDLTHSTIVDNTNTVPVTGFSKDEEIDQLNKRLDWLHK